MLAAAQNNARWCDLVCRSHGIPTAIERGQWVARRRAPDLYPDAVTLRPGAVAEDLLEAVDDGPGCSVKDSFADLDLADLGFEELFAARWIFRHRECRLRYRTGTSGDIRRIGVGAPPRREPAVPSSRSVVPWAVIETDDALAEWARAAGAPDTFRGELLREPSVRVLAARGPEGLSAGAIANRTRSVVGVSNVFTTSMTPDEAWTGVVDVLAVLFPGLPLVGYKHGEGIEPALASGFTELGSLRVWWRPDAWAPAA